GSISTLPEDKRARETTNEFLKSTIEAMETRKQTILPASFPIAVAGRLIYRTQEGVEATRAASGELAWRHSTWGGLSPLLSPGENRLRPAVKQWMAGYLQNDPPNVLVENSLLGTLSSDGSRVYLIDDLAIPPPPPLFRYSRLAGRSEYLPYL